MKDHLHRMVTFHFHHRLHILAQLHQIIHLHIEFHHSRFQTRKVKNIKYQIGQLFGIPLDSFREILPLYLRQTSLATQTVRQAHHQIKRNTYLICYVMQKNIFHLVGSLSHSIRFAHSLFRFHQFTADMQQLYNACHQKQKEQRPAAYRNLPETSDPRLLLKQCPLNPIVSLNSFLIHLQGHLIERVTHQSRNFVSLCRLLISSRLHISVSQQPSHLTLIHRLGTFESSQHQLIFSETFLPFFFQTVISRP